MNLLEVCPIDPIKVICKDGGPDSGNNLFHGDLMELADSLKMRFRTPQSASHQKWIDHAEH